MAAPSSAVGQAQAAAALAAEEQAAAAAAAGEEQPEAAAAAAAQAAEAAAAQVAAAAAVVVHPPPPPVNQNPEVNVGGDQPAVNLNAVLQQLLAGQQAQAVFNANIAQQLEQLHQQQPPVAAPFAGQFLAEPAGGVLHPLPAIGGVPHPHPPAAAAPARAAAPAGLSEGAKLAAKLQANLWATDAATPKWFIIRGGFHVGRVMNKERLTLATRKFALITDKAAAQISKLTDFAAEHFFTKMPDGVLPTAMPPQMHITVAVKVFFAAIEAGMGGADALCTERVKSLHREFLAVESQLSAYLTLHFVELAAFPAKTRDTVLAAYNIGFNDFFHDLAARGEDLLQEHSNGPPTSASVISMESPKFTKLKNLIKEEDSNSLVARSKSWSAEKTAPPTPAAASAAAASAGEEGGGAGAPTLAAGPGPGAGLDGAGSAFRQSRHQEGGGLQREPVPSSQTSGDPSGFPVSPHLGSDVQCNHNSESVPARTAGTDALGAAGPDVRMFSANTPTTQSPP
ncbi:unnamed protein product [Ectocarpus sp. CCAP 1310/34]|nr:unnamed protein product [Ectocarpus sp. CCAP 1310/34]